MTTEQTAAVPAIVPNLPSITEREGLPEWPGGVADLFVKAIPGLQFEARQALIDVVITVARADILRVLKTAKTHAELQFDFLRSLTGVDWEDAGREVVYHLYSNSKKHNVTIKARCPADDPRMPSATEVWLGADWHERETFDMFGIVFEGHPNLVPILLPDDFEGIHPLLKSRPLAPLEVKQGAGLTGHDAEANE